MKNKLYRSREDAMLGGVCGGLGRYLGIDPTVVRLAFLLAGLYGAGAILYLGLWVIVPREALGEATDEVLDTGAQEIAEKARSLHNSLRGTGGQHNQAPIFLGIALALTGIVLLAQEFHLWWLNFDLLWPALMILGGILLIQRRARAA